VLLKASELDCSVQLLLLVGDNGAVAGGVGHAGQHKAVGGLGVVQEALVALVNGTSLNLAGAAGACTWEQSGTQQESVSSYNALLTDDGTKLCRQHVQNLRNCSGALAAHALWATVAVLLLLPGA
jgi:hypothetical protein